MPWPSGGINAPLSGLPRCARTHDKKCKFRAATVIAMHSSLSCKTDTAKISLEIQAIHTEGCSSESERLLNSA
jgi:hypothetical protein